MKECIGDIGLMKKMKMAGKNHGIAYRIDKRETVILIFD